MKTIFRTKFIVLFLLSACTFSAISQPLSGNYTIGGLTPDYASFSAAVGAVLNNGVSGPVVFNVRNGIYHEKVSMFQFAGSSSINTVTFQSEDNDSSLVILSDSSSTSTLNNFTLQIFGADHIVFRQITIQRPGTNVNGRVIEIGNNSDDIAFLNNRIMAGSATATSIAKCLIYSDSINQNTDIVITGNLMVNGNYGIYKLASQLETGNIISNNIFENQYVGSIYVYKQDGIVISENKIAVNGSTNYSAITLSRSVNGCITNKNKISVLIGNAGIKYLDCLALNGSENLTTNNFIHLAGTTVNSGIHIGASTNINIFHNSVNMTGTSATSSALFTTGIGNSGIQLLNNIFNHSGTGYAIRLSDTNAVSSSDFNVLLTSGINLGSYNAINATTLANWQTLSSKDINSINVNPVFTSVTDLHSSSVGINDKGTPITIITADIDGETRSLTNPDPGADEFTPLNFNMSLNTILSPVNYSCGDSNTTVTVIVQNLGIDSAISIPVTIEVTGSQTFSLFDTVPGPLAPYASDTISVSGTWITYQGGVYDLKCYTSLPNDQYTLNDTLLKTFTFIGIPDTPSVSSPQTFCEGNINISALTDSANVIFWYDQPSGGNLLFSGNPFSPAITGDTIFYAEAHAGSGGGGCLRITEMGMNTPDHLEIQNCSAGPVDVTGWVVAISNNYSDINLENTILWDLTSLGTMAPGQIEYKTDGTGNNYWGNNMLWNPGATTPGWAIIIDNAGNIIDFAAYGWSDANLQLFNPVINNFQITLGTNWSGSSINPVCATPNSLNRTGNTDNDDANDFICTGASVGTLNASLTIPFASCGASACGSARVPVTVQVFQQPVINLGPDTVSALPVTFDAGAGFAGYLWNTGDTSQTINATSTGTYSVIVTDSNGCTATDSVLYTSTAGISGILSVNNIILFPNPATDKIMVSVQCTSPQEIAMRLTNALGETTAISTKTLLTGPNELVINIGHFSRGVYTLEIHYKDGIINKKCLLK